MPVRIFLCLLLMPLFAQAAPAMVSTDLQIDGVEIRFPADYSDAKAKFRQLVADVKKIEPRSQWSATPVDHPVDKDLSIDGLWIPSSSGRLVILSSGIHGAEAFAGHAIQELFLKKWMASPQRDYQILIIHGINPYGFKHFLRVNPANVDLNRNFADAEDFKKPNADYQKLQKLFHPHERASATWVPFLGFYMKTLFTFVTRGKKKILGGLSGQYSDPQGLYYGGQELQPETLATQALIKKYATTATEIIHIDLHTGFGEKGRLHLMANEATVDEHTRAVFSKHTIDTGDKDDFYPTTGDMIQWVRREFQSKRVAAITFEFGTMDSQTIRGGLKSLWTSVLENQGRHYGYVLEKDKQLIDRHYQALFNPPSPQWQQRVLQTAADSLAF